MFEFLGNPACHENIVKVGAYVLGEYGHLIADEAVSLPLLVLRMIQISDCAVNTGPKPD